MAEQAWRLVPVGAPDLQRAQDQAGYGGLLAAAPDPLADDALVDAVAQKIMGQYGPVLGTPEYLAEHGDRIMSRQRNAADALARDIIAMFTGAATNG